MNLLARREHSRAELLEKLSRRFAAERVGLVLDDLAAENLQSDSRFVEAFVRSRITRLQGPGRIRQELLQSGVHVELIGTALRHAASDWVDQACMALARRYTLADLADRRAQDKACQYLYRRGFDAEDCRRAVRRFLAGGSES